MPRAGRHFLQIPGPTNTPDRVLRAMAAPSWRPASKCAGAMSLLEEQYTVIAWMREDTTGSIIAPESVL